MLAEFAIGKPSRKQAKDKQRSQKCQHGRVIQTHGRGTLAVNGDRAGNVMESIFAGHGIVAESLDVQETSVGIVADLPQLWKILQPLSDAKVAGVVNRRLGTEGSALLVILFDVGSFVVDVQRRGYPVGEDASSEPPGGRLSNSTVEDELDAIGATKVHILTYNLFKEFLTSLRPGKEHKYRF